ncbi:conserved hypothetical protein [Culex quinquefasciatus]|uniref:DUF4802 domain-containing protein n=1 Tax=Culex quinquefasciatus TaxID=7176 RepID=B0WVH9_CULQU|nr:uncharacterized protein LOC6043802 [Culex quinquefasciatus]XP_038119581.1 uncharacterized protein LOC6043802 [Culex quinquefasciatus]XP_038119582.1 uncharacterized protein LOC6043802 [Culex quinquefasciatus]XP_039442142.1 uncharacterized protein LOC120422697 [Culex pipiens pallens]XP_039442143.1 uncharacterized protein LOC120422697 [Culex pipiens pallens]EDS35585.1 conserved hypothetical protein [Culex quinquefasciatus]|eukprot:XP_001861401.1 conserved hypothetical protein [Culex quinquefasciatus]
MAPFKLRFRMGSGSSRSASQEQDVVVDSQANQMIVQTNSYLSSSGNNTAAYGSSTTLDSEQNNDSLVSMSNDQRALIRDRDSPDERIGYVNPTLTHTEGTTIPLSPPPSYEHVLEENRLAALDKENNKTSTLSLSPSSYDMFGSNQQLTACTPQDQQQSYDQQSQQQATPNTTRKQESIDSSLYSCSSGTSPSQENLLGCTGSCDPLYNMAAQEHMEDLAEEMEDMHIEETCLSNDNLDDGSYTDECQSSYDPHAYEGTSSGSVVRPEIKGPEILYKSSKQLYKAVAKECGITCKMSDQCRCLDCQSRYFDCEYDQNENEKTDGGLGAGTPMFISEVMHGSACTIL